MAIEPTKINFTNVRNERQKLNNKLVFDAIKSNNIPALSKCCNMKALDRVLDETNLKLEELVVQCSTNDIMNIILSGRISKIATRQGAKDEDLQLQMCNNVAKNYDIEIKKLSSNEYRPAKNGKILSSTDDNIPLHECLKSFDAKISGKVNGWMFAKVVFGSGGHQDNVFEEADVLCEWVKNHCLDSEEIYVLLIDTNLERKYKELSEKYDEIKNLIISNHYDFQKYIIKNFHKVKD